MKPIRIAILLIAVVLAVIIISVLNPFVTVEAGERGVVLTWGAFGGQILEPGLHFRTPFAQRVVKINVQQQNIGVDASESYTKDGQQVNIQSALLYAIDPASVGELYQKIGLNYEMKVIRPILEETVKTEAAKYTAIEIPANRAKIGAAVEAVLREKLLSSYLVVIKYTFVNEDFADSYENAINEKQTREQQAKTAEYDTKISEQKKQQAILEAQAQAESIRIQAEALAKNADLVKLKAVEKWDGKLPTQMVPGSAVPFLDLR